MRQSPGSYTRFISVAKVIMALAAIALLGTVFLFTKEQNLEGGLKFSQAEFEALETGMHIAKPLFSGMNEAGDVYDFKAESVQPTGAEIDQIVVQKLSGEIRYEAGNAIHMRASSAEFSTSDEVLTLTGNIQFEMSDGTIANTEVLRAELQSGLVVGEKQVSASSPLGEISSGSFRLENIEVDGQEKQMLWFENGVKLLFRPDSWDENE